jgi:signal transduction histidine kinase/CheY-like chemotaxis protein
MTFEEPDPGATIPAGDPARLRRGIQEEGTQEDHKSLINLLRLTCDNLPDMVWAKDLQQRYMFTNKALCNGLLNAQDTEEPLGKTDLFFALRERESRPENRQYHTFGEICQDSDIVVMRNRAPARFDEFGNVKGQFLFLDVHKAPLWDDQGRLIGTVGCGRDVTKERRMEKELRESERRYRNIFDSAAVPIWEEDFSELKVEVDSLKASGISDFPGYLDTHPKFLDRCSSLIKVVDVNSAAVQLYGARDKSELLGALDQVLLPESRNALRELVLAIVQGQTHYEAETVNRTLRGETLQILLKATIPPPNEEPHRLLVNIVDLTAMRALEQQQQRTHRLESLGVLAGGLAHDFNNLLVGVLGHISLAKLNLDPDSKAFLRLQEAERASERTKKLTWQLLTFSKGGDPVKQVLSVRDFVDSATRFFLSGSNVKAESTFQPDLWEVEADDDQITQVLGNLLLNASEAMPGGGTIRVHAENYVDQERKAFVEIRVVDQGIGIPEGFLHKIFDPYFSTKQKGHGLGLAIVFSIIKRHGGVIDVESRLGGGTSVRIRLPRAQQTLPVVQEVTQIGQGRSGSVLVMDDDPVVREVASAMLENLGFQVESAPEGGAMLTAYEAALRADRPFTFVLIDLTVTCGMGGLEAVQGLLKLDPSALAIVSSGYSNDPILASPADYGFRGILQKPYRFEELQRVVAQHIPVGS